MKKPKTAATVNVLETARVLEGASSWVIFSHAKPDGDAIGGACALFEAGALLGKRVRWLGVDPVSPNYLFLPRVEEYATQKKYKFNSKSDLYIFLDSANEDRGIEGLKEKSPEAVVLNIDHHEDNTMFGTLNCVDSRASSTSELLWRIMSAAKWPITQAVAECLFTGIAADTGWFAFSNTTSDTHLAAADLMDRGVDQTKVFSCMSHSRSIEASRLWGLAFLRIFRWGESSQFAMTWLSQRDFDKVGAVPSDTEALINQLLTIRDVNFAVLLTEDTKQVKGSFRSKGGTVTAASVARALGGGGHPRAAGANLALPLGDAVRVVQETVDKLYAQWALADR